MPLTKITGFVGEAELLSSLRRVTFADGSLTIHEVSLDETYAILDALGTKQIIAVRVQSKSPTPPRDVIVPPPPDKMAELNRKATELGYATPEAQSSAAAIHAELEKEARKPQIVPQPPGPEMPAKPQEQGTSEPSRSSEDRAAQPNESAPAGTVPPKIIESKRFIEVLDWVILSNGFKRSQVDEIVAACEAIKEQVPVVRRVRDLKDKVVSNLASYAEGGAPSA